MQTKRQKEYREYLLSESWKQRKVDLANEWGNKCAWCGSTNVLNLHHLNYDSLEKETVKDVILLCKGCHLRAHKGTLTIWGFTEEERLAFEKIKHIICSSKKCDYRIYTYKIKEI